MLAAKPYLQSTCIRPDTEVDYDTYPYNIPAIRELGLLEFHPDVTFFVGENGSGKSTLLEGIALAGAVRGGVRGHRALCCNARFSQQLSPAAEAFAGRRRGEEDA